MILEIIKTNCGKVTHCKCDKCGKEFKRPLSQTNKHNHFCSRDCAGSGRSEFNPNVCKICGKPRDNTFYDKSATRPLCSKACYSKWFDDYYKLCVKWERKRPPNNMGNDVKRDYVYPKQGRLIAYYNYGV